MKRAAMRTHDDAPWTIPISPIVTPASLPSREVSHLPFTKHSGAEKKHDNAGQNVWAGGLARAVVESAS